MRSFIRQDPFYTTLGPFSAALEMARKTLTTPSEVQSRALNIPEIAFGVADFLSHHDRINLAAVNRRLHAVLGQDQGLWGGPHFFARGMPHGGPEKPSAQQVWVNAWSQRANLSPPELRAALRRKMNDQPRESLPDLYSPHYLGVEILVCRTNHYARELVSGQTVYLEALANRDEAWTLACAAAAKIGLALADRDLKQFEAYHRATISFGYARSSAERGEPMGMDLNLRDAATYAKQAKLVLPNFPEDLRLDAYAQGMARCQEYMLTVARDCMLSAVLINRETMNAYADSARIPRPNPMSDALVNACREGLDQGEREAIKYAYAGDFDMCAFVVKNVKQLADIAGLQAPATLAAITEKSQVIGRDVAMQRAEERAETGDPEMMEHSIALSHRLANTMHIPQLDFSIQTRQAGYRGGARKAFHSASYLATQGEIFHVLSELELAARWTKRAGDELCWEPMQSIVDTLHNHGHDDKGRIRGLFVRKTRTTPLGKALALVGIPWWA